MTVNTPDPPPKGLAYRITNLKRQAPQKTVTPSEVSRRVDLIGSVVICAIVGALIDRAFGTFPWGFIIVTLFGVAVSVATSKMRSPKR